MKTFKSIEEVDIDVLFDIVINVTLPKVMNVRYLPIKYLFHDADKLLDFNMSNGQKIHLHRKLSKKLETYFKENSDYVFVRKLKRFGQYHNVDLMLELYEIDNPSYSGSAYFEKLDNFITKGDVINGNSSVAKAYQPYLTL